MKPGTKKKYGKKKQARDKQILRRYIQLIGETEQGQAGITPDDTPRWHHLIVARLAVEFRMERAYIKKCIRSAATRSTNDRMVSAMTGWIPGIQIAWGGDDAIAAVDIDPDEAVRRLVAELEGKPRSVGDMLPTELILQIQEHMPEGGRITIPPRPRSEDDGIRIRRMIPTEEVIRQDVMMTYDRVNNSSLRAIGEAYGISHARVDTISVETLKKIAQTCGKGVDL
tara:strand:- start:2143 stop:2820 length:678 start_codon:yes stop_codon:yes gene_type:complete